MLTNYAGESLAGSLASLPESERMAFLQALTATELATLEYDWRSWARPKQLPPPGGWLTWLLQTGRGFGKSRAGAGWVHRRAMDVPGRWCALIAKTPADARDVMIDGPAGLLRNTPPNERPIFESTKRRVTWPNGSWGTLYSSEEPDQLRGFSGDTAWLDEFGKYSNPREVWDNLQFGMREASTDLPRVCITTTPRPLPILEEIEAKPSTVTVKGSSYENRANLAPTWFSETLAAYEGTRLGRQEIHGERLDDVEGRVYSSFVNLPFPFGNIDASVRDTGAEIYVGQDFNVNPMSVTLGVKAGDQLHIFDAIEVATSNTEEVAQMLRQRYPNRRVIVCPDPSGNARKTSAAVGQTDFTILQRQGFYVDAAHKAPLISDRINAVQALLKDAAGTRRLLVHPKARALVRSLDGLTYKEDTSIPDKGSGLDHMADALGYLVWQRFNLLETRRAIVRNLYA
mgnify:CR=1 FL=1